MYCFFISVEFLRRYSKKIMDTKNDLKHLIRADMNCIIFQLFLRLTSLKDLTEIRAQISIYIRSFKRDATFKRPLKLVYKWIITRHFSYGCHYLSYPNPNSDLAYLQINEAMVNVLFHMQKRQRSGSLAVPMLTWSDGNIFRVAGPLCG